MNTISVVIPAFNAGRFLAAAIASVLAQELPADEIIVVDDGSTDDTRDVVQGFGERVRLISQANAGTAAARNAGICAATGELIALLDADDLMLPKRLQLQADALQALPAVDAVFCLQWLFRDGEAIGDSNLTPPPTGAFQERLRPGLVPGTMLARRSAFNTFGLFPAAARVGEFIAWFGHAQALGLRYRTVELPLVQRRIHAASLSQTARADYALLVRQMRTAGSIAGRRAA